MPQFLPSGSGPFAPRNPASLGGFAGSPYFLSGLDELDKLLMTNIGGPVAAQASDVAAGGYYDQQNQIAQQMAGRGLLTSGANTAAQAGNIAGLGEGLVGAGVKGTQAQQGWQNNILGSIEGLATGMSGNVANQLGAKGALQGARMRANTGALGDFLGTLDSLFGQGGLFSNPSTGAGPFAGMTSAVTTPVANALGNVGSDIGSLLSLVFS